MKVAPLSPVLAVAPDETGSQEITITNDGAAPLSGLTIDLGALPDWIYLGAPSLVTTTLAPAESYTFILFASPTITDQGVTYQQPITISVAGGLQQVVAPTIKVTADNTRNLVLTVTDSDSQPVPGATITLIRQAPSLQVSQGVTQTYHEHFTAQANGSGQVSFTALPVGNYDYVIKQPGYKINQGTLPVEPDLSGGTSSQQLAFELIRAPFDYVWTVTPLQVGYEIALTMTHAVDNEGVDLLAPTRSWEFCQNDSSLQDNIAIYNVSNAPATFGDVVVDVPGVDVTVNSFPTALLPGESGLIDVSATRVSEALGQGTIFIEGSYLAGDNDRVSYTFNPSSVTSPYFAEGTTTQLDYVLEPAVFDPGLDYTLTISQPVLLDWISLAADVAPTFPLTSETDITVTLTATAPTWLTLNETYSDTAAITLAGSDGESRQNYLDIEVTRTTQGVKIHTTFRLGDIATVQKPLASSGLIYARFVSCGGGGGGPTNSTGSSGGWTWTPLPNGGGLRGTRQSSSGSSGGSPPFADVVNTSEAWVIGEADQQVRIQLNQRLMLAGEGFQANLTMQNLSLDAVDNIEVNLIISDTNAVPVNSSFVITPVVPTALTDTLPAGQQILGSWLIVPTESITDAEGKTYYAAAEVTYEIGGNSYSFTTLPEEFTVLPAPELAVAYRLPGPSYTCSTFDLEATVYNTGFGPARGVNISSGQPKLVESTSFTPQGFEIVAVSVDGQPLSTLDLNVTLGDIPAGQSRQVVWRMQTTDPGRFVEFTSGYHQIRDYVGLPLVAPRLTISTTFTTPTDPFLYGCLTGDFNITGTVKDEQGEPVTDVVFAVDYSSADATLTSTTIITPLMELTGVYTLPNLAAGIYTFFPVRTEALTSSQALLAPASLLPSYTVIPAGFEAVQAQQTTSTSDDYEECVAIIERFQVQGLIPSAVDAEESCAGLIPYAEESNLPQDATAADGTTDPDEKFIMPGIPPDPIPETHAFKGAGYLDFVGGADDNIPATSTDYDNLGIGWNVERIEDIRGNTELQTQIGILKNDEGVETIVRLDDPDREGRMIEVDGVRINRGPLPDGELDPEGECDQIEDWMLRVDTAYIETLHQISGQLIDKFVLGNEPNHHRDEWHYNAEEYAFVYNCYYDHWYTTEIEPGRPGVRHDKHALYVAGPGQEAGGINQWDVFEPVLFDKITHADGFAMHVYGYYRDDAQGDALFKPWLTDIMSNTNSSKWAGTPVIITEYNPGDVNVPPNGDNLEGWTDWFTQTYCWVKSAQNQYPNAALRGLIYFVDTTDQWRHKEEGQGWWDISLYKSLTDRRQPWLNLNDSMCPQTSTPNKLNVIPAKFSSHQLAQDSPSNVSIGGVVSGTLGIPAGDKVYYVNGDLEVPAGQTLTIASGTTLVFSPGHRMIVAGQLLADGGTIHPIRFVSYDQAGWEGIHFQTSASGSWCTGCYLENIRLGGIAIQADAPITLLSSLIRDVPVGTAISTTVPITLSNTVIDYAGTGIYLSGQPSQTHTISHLTLSRCQDGIVNHGQNLNLMNSILTTCGAAVSTELSATTTVSYTLFYNNLQDFVTESNSHLNQGTGLLNTDPRFVDFPTDVTLRPDSPAVNAADPQADYHWELGYNGGRADLGAYGNTWRAPQRPPLDQMAVSLTAISPVLVGQPGGVVSYTLTLKNNGSVSDNYKISARSDAPYVTASFAPDHYQEYLFTDLAPQEQITMTVWVQTPLTSTLELSKTILMSAVGIYGIADELQLTALISSFQEANGQVVMEAEHAAGQINRSGRSWLTQTVLSGYIGSAYLSALPDTDIQFTSTSSPELYYTVNITTTGTYTVWLRGYAPNAAGDSVYLSLDNQPAITLTGFVPGTWGWANSNAQGGVVTIQVAEPGLHTLHLWQREDGLRVDRIALTYDNSYNPSGDGPPESEIR